MFAIACAHPRIRQSWRCRAFIRHAGRRFLLLSAGALLLTGCASLSSDGGMSFLANTAGRDLGKDVAAIRTPEQAFAAQARVQHLLRRPLSADDAVQIALLNNRGLQAAYNALGIAEAEMVQASLPPSPGLSLERIVSAAEIEIETRIVANILAIATLPARAEIATDRFRQAQLRAAEETLRVAAETRRAYYRAVAQQELAGVLAQTQSAAETAAQLARRLSETGAMNKLDTAREQVFFLEITAQLATARQRAASERERLIRLTGLWGGDTDFKLPRSLPALPRRLRGLPSIEMDAIARRVDLQVARIEVEALAKTLGLVEASRFISLFEVAGIGKTNIERATGHRERGRGFELELQIPIFDWGETRARQASETYMQAVNRLIDKAVTIRSEARDAYGVYRSTYGIATRYRREILPLRKTISEEMLLRYNAMQIDVFALLVESRQRLAVTIAAIEAQREFWLATTNLLVATVGGGGSSGATAEGPRPSAAGSEAAAH